MVIYKIEFKRTIDSPWEYGIYSEGEELLIIDAQGKLVKGMIYTRKSLATDFCIDLRNILKN
jgi:hypothetical protein